MLPGSLLLGVHQLVVNDFFYPISDAIHLPNPFNLIFGFKLLCNPLLLCQSFNQLKKHDFCLNVNLSQMVIQLAIEKQSVVE